MVSRRPDQAFGERICWGSADQTCVDGAMDLGRVDHRPFCRSSIVLVGRRRAALRNRFPSSCSGQRAHLDNGTAPFREGGHQARFTVSISAVDTASPTGVRAVADLLPVSRPLPAPAETSAAAPADPVRPGLGHATAPVRSHHQMKSKTQRNPPWMMIARANPHQWLRCEHDQPDHDVGHVENPVDQSRRRNSSTSTTGSSDAQPRFHVDGDPEEGHRPKPVDVDRRPGTCGGVSQQSDACKHDPDRAPGEQWRERGQACRSPVGVARCRER